jgi:DNA-binding transcriptional LysR family regulator
MAMTALPVEEGSHLTTLPLFSHPLCVLTPRTAPWEGVQLIVAAGAGRASAGHLQRGFALSQQLMRLFAQHDVKPRIAVRSGQWDFLAAMVQAGIGMAILPEPICQRLDPQSFCWIPLQSELRWELGMIWREGVYMSRSARAWLACSKAFWLE